MRPATVRAALYVPGLPPQTSRLLVYMADAAGDDNGTFFRSRARMVHETGIHEDTIKTGIRNLIKLGYISEVQRARTGKNTRILRLHPDAWPQPTPWQRPVHEEDMLEDPMATPTQEPISTDPSAATPALASATPDSVQTEGAHDPEGHLTVVRARVLRLRQEARAGRHLRQASSDDAWQPRRHGQP